MSYENGERQLIEIHSPLSIEAQKQKVVITKEVKLLVGKNTHYWQQLATIIEKPLGLVVELGL